MAIAASVLVGQHLNERTEPRVEGARVESAGVGSFRRVHVCVCMRYVRRAWLLGATAMYRIESPQPWISLGTVAYSATLQHFLFCD